MTTGTQVRRPSLATARCAAHREPGFSPELLLLLSLLRRALGTGDSTETEALCHGVDWRAFGACVERHRVGAFLHQRLPGGIRSLLPEAADRGLEELWRANVRRALIRASELVRLTRLLDDAGVFVISLKGPLLAQQLYGDLGLRHAGDIDLLIAPEDVDRADVLLRRTGEYRRQEPNFELTPLQKKKFVQSRKEFGYQCDQPRIRIELMWRLEQFSDGDAAGWSIVKERLGGCQINILPPEVNTHYLFMHGARHAWFRLFWLVDAARLMADNKIDWSKVVAEGRRTRTDRSLLVGSLLARELLGASIPPSLLSDSSERRTVARLRVSARDWIARDAADGLKAVGFLSQFIYRIRLQQGWRAKFGALKDRFIFVTGWKILRLPDKWFGLYYPLSPFLCLYHLVARRGRVSTT